ncbi:MAG: HAD family hydrolase [Planctomycetota bacterium]
MLPKALIICLWNVLYCDRARQERTQRAAARLSTLLQEAGIAAEPAAVQAICERLVAGARAEELAVACPPLVQRVMDLSRECNLPIPSQVAAVFARKAAQEAVNFAPPAPFPEAFKMLQKLAGHYALVLVANTTLPGGAGLREVLDGDHLLQFFRAAAFSDEIGVGLPDPKPFRMALDWLGLEARDVWVVAGDMHLDILPARALRLPIIMVARPTLGADAVTSSSTSDVPIISPVESVPDLAALARRLKAD